LIELSREDRLIWRQLRDRASAGSSKDPQNSCIHYGELGKLVDPDGVWHYPRSRPPMHGFGDALGHVSRYEHEHGRPLLSALVTAVDTDKPGKGFAEFAESLGIQVGDPDTFWSEEVSRVVKFWSSSDDTLLLDAAVDRVLRELAAIRQLLTEPRTG
jgi:hypothetical protein